MTLGERIKKFREKEKISQREFAKLIGVSATYICDLESSNTLISTVPQKLVNDINDLIGYPQNDEVKTAADRNSAIGEKIHAARIHRGINLKDIASHFNNDFNNVSGGIYRRMEASGFSRTTKKNIEIISNILPEIKKYFDYTIEDFENEDMEAEALYNSMVNIIVSNINSNFELSISYDIYKDFINHNIDYNTLYQIVYKFISKNILEKDKLRNIFYNYTEKIGLDTSVDPCNIFKEKDDANAEDDEATELLAADTVDKNNTNILSYIVNDSTYLSSLKEDLSTKNIDNLKSEDISRIIFEDSEERETIISILYDMIDDALNSFDSISNEQKREVIIITKWFNRVISKSERLMIKLKGLEK